MNVRTSCSNSASATPGFWKIELVEDRVFGLRHHGRRTNRSARPEWHAKADDRAEAVGAQQRRMPRHDGTPIVAGDDRLVGAERVEQAHHVAD